MSQITIGETTFNFKDSAFTGDQWEQVATWVLNGGAENIDKNAEIATEKAGQAISAASTAAASSSAAQSYAVGGTGTRQGEDTDNAKYYAQLAHSAAGGGVLSVNGVIPDENGNVVIDSGGVKTVNGVAPDDSGNVVIDVDDGGVKTINGGAPDENGNVEITANGIGAATMSEVNAAIAAAITGAIEGSY